jgi:hypothetical protein
LALPHSRPAHPRGGTARREEAERQCLDAIAFALEGDPTDYDDEAQAIALEVSVAPAA